MNRGAAFLDRDGTINEEREYINQRLFIPDMLGENLLDIVTQIEIRSITGT